MKAAGSLNWSRWTADEKSTSGGGLDGERRLLAMNEAGTGRSR